MEITGGSTTGQSRSFTFMPSCIQSNPFFFFFFFVVAHVLIIPFLALFFFFSPGALGHTHGSPRMTSKSPTSERPLSLVTVSEPVLSDVFETANSPV